MLDDKARLGRLRRALCEGDHYAREWAQKELLRHNTDAIEAWGWEGVKPLYRVMLEEATAKGDRALPDYLYRATLIQGDLEFAQEIYDQVMGETVLPDMEAQNVSGATELYIGGRDYEDVDLDYMRYLGQMTSELSRALLRASRNRQRLSSEEVEDLAFDIGNRIQEEVAAGRLLREDVRALLFHSLVGTPHDWNLVRIVRDACNRRVTVRETA